MKYQVGIWRYFILGQVCQCWLQFEPAVRVGKIDEFFLVSSSVAWMRFFGYAFRNIMKQLWHSSFMSGANWWQSVKSILSALNFQKLKVWFLVFWFFVTGIQNHSHPSEMFLLFKNSHNLLVFSSKDEKFWYLQSCMLSKYTSVFENTWAPCKILLFPRKY